MEEELKTIQIQGTEFSFAPEKSYEKDGHIYCKSCQEQIDSEPFDGFGKVFIFKRQCACDRAKEAKEKERQRLMQVNALKDRCFLSPIQKQYTFENLFKTQSQNSVALAQSYVKHFDEMAKENCGLFIYGNVGSGKTYLACAIANAVTEQYLYTVKIINLSQMINDLQHGGYDMNRNDYIRQKTSTSLLIIDDLGVERNTEYALEQMYQIINQRYLTQKPTIFTSNIDYNVIKSGNSDLTMQRMYSRIKEMTLPLKIVGKDKRDEIMEVKKTRAKDILYGE